MQGYLFPLESAKICMNPKCFAVKTERWTRGLCDRCYQAACKSGEIKKYPREVRVCGRCGMVFEIRSSKSRYCSSKCQLETTAIRRRRVTMENEDKKRGRVCNMCPNAIPVSAKAQAKSCSVKCQQASWYEENERRLRSAAREWSLANPEKVIDYRHRRRSRKRNAPYEMNIDVLAVCERDNFECWICDTPVDMTLKHPNPLSKNLDHIIPLARGGTHTFNNLALSHSKCNLKKGTRVLDKVPRWWVDADANRMAAQS